MLLKIYSTVILFLNLMEAEGASIRLLAGGADAAGPVYTRWWQLFHTVKEKALDIEYKYLGSVRGKLWIKRQLEELKGLTPVFVGSDTPMALNDHLQFKNLRIFPIIADAVAVVFNIPNITDLVLSRETLTDIFLGHIKYWNDSQIRRYNPDTDLPDKEIQPVVRREGAGTTEVFTTALSAFSEEWKNGPGIFSKPNLVDGINGEGPSLNWPDHGAKYFAWTTGGGAALVKAIPYAIGFLGIGAAEKWDLDIVTLINDAGFRIPPSKITAGAKEAMNYFADRMDKDHLTANIVNGPSDAAYPIPNLSYFIVNSTTSPEVTCEQMKAFVRLVHWALTHPEAVEAVQDNKLVPLSHKMVKLVEENILAKITCHGQSVEDMIAEEDAPGIFTLSNITIFGAICLVLILLVAVVAVYSFRYAYIIQLVRCSWVMVQYLESGDMSIC